MAGLVEFSRARALRTTVLSSPETMDRVSAEQAWALLEACDALDADTSIACATFTSSGDVFCAGGEPGATLQAHAQSLREAVSATVERRLPRFEGR